MSFKCIIILIPMIFGVFGLENLRTSSRLNLSINDNIEPDTSVHKSRSLPDVEVPNNTTTTTENWSTLSEILDVYNTKNLAKNWQQNKYPVSNQCAKDITRYIEGLRKYEIWALKADDASGRFTNGFYWGNSYFMGSATECYYIGYDYSRKNDKSDNQISEAQEFNGEPKKTMNKGFSGSHISYSIPDTPPYKLGFFVMTIAINDSNITPMMRSIQLGVCLPFSCTSGDLWTIGKLAASPAALKHSVIEKIRDQREYYNIYEDSVFWALFGSSIFVAVLMAIGTGYDYYLSSKHPKKHTEKYSLEKHAKLEEATNRRLSNEFDGKIYMPVPVGDTVGTISVTPVNNNNDHETTVPPIEHPSFQQLNVGEELLLSFSVRENMRTICDPGVGRDTISTIHGLRAISMAWVILGHTCIVIFKYSDNMEYRKVVEKKFLFQTITNGAFSVDTFFFMGGLLVSYLFFRTNAMGDLNKLTQGTQGFAAGFLKFIGLLLYRFCRLTTPYMYVLGVVQVTMKWFYANSVFEPPAADHENCPNYWWRNLLYINTLFPVDQMCMLWSWYVADDTQFYIVGAVILVIATNHLKVAAFSVAALMISSWLTTGYIALINNHMPSSDDPLALFDKIYDKPWTRLGPYLIGMSVGYYLFITDCKVKIPKASVVLGWVLSSTCLLCLLYGLYEAELSPITAAAYSSLSHSAWALGLAWIVIACSTGNGGWVNKILSAPILYPFSRVTYCAYLIHPIIIRLTAMNLDSPFHLGKDTVVITFIGQVVLSYAASFIVSLSFEAPIVSMLKILSPKKKKRVQ